MSRAEMGSGTVVQSTRMAVPATVPDPISARPQYNKDSILNAKLSEYVKVAEAAEILGVSQGTVRTWAEAGKLPMHKNPANGYRLFLRGDLEAFLEQCAKPCITKPR